MANIYFELTEAFNHERPTVALASGQAVVFYRIAIMSKDGDWVIREAPDACHEVLSVLEARGAHYRLSAPLDVRWLAGGWSSHFEFFDEQRRRIRCDIVSRPPRVSKPALERLWQPAEGPRLAVVDVESLILMKQTQRAKDYAAIGALATLLSPERELALTTDPDRILGLAPKFGGGSTRPAVRAALTGAGRRAVVVALAEEADALQQGDRRRVMAYQAAAERYFSECRSRGVTELRLRDAHAQLVELAERWLPIEPEGLSHADAQ